MKVYVGRWDLLPKDWEGINGLYEKSEEEIRYEISREIDEWAKTHHVESNLIGAYTMAEFEEQFNGDNNSELHGTTYFVKFFDENNKSVLSS